MRVHELAKKLNLSNKDVLTKLQAAGFDVKTHSSGVDEQAAMKVLDGGTTEDKPAPKRRMMIRRRKKTEEAPVETSAPVVETPEMTESVEDIVEASAEAVAPQAPSVEQNVDAVDSQNEPPAGIQPVVEAANAVIETTATPTDTKTDDVKTAQVAAPAAEEPKKAKAAEPTNIVRRIDPEAIKNRLQAEGRKFSPGPRRTFSKVKEFKVVNDRFGSGPQIVDVSNQRGGARPGANNKKGGGGRSTNYRESREQRSAQGFWLNPGKKKKNGKRGKSTEITTAAAHKRVIEMTDSISVGDLAHQMAVKGGQVVGKLMQMGMMVTVNQSVDFDTATLVAAEFDFEVKNVKVDDTDLIEQNIEAPKEANKAQRPPVVTVMGHVDHGKTSLLDYIRSSRVASGEAGGITQHIGAYTVDTSKGQITFLDTPGHAAFTAMRARGATVTDVVILVVAADDGVMPQTAEAIAHSKSAGVPLVVAVNKCDKPDAKPERVMQQLTEHELVPEEWGGDTIMVNVSAHTGEGVESLLEAVALQAEVLELKADPTVHARGTVIEAQLDKGRGAVATLLISEGTLKPGQYMVAGQYHGRVRALLDHTGARLKEAGPASPVQVLGLSGVPTAGDRFDIVKNDKMAKQVAEMRTQKQRDADLKNSTKVSLEDFMNKKSGDSEKFDIRLIVKADVSGSAEALCEALKNLATERVNVTIVHSGVGTITENDVNLAMASEAIVVGFNSKPDNKANALAQNEQVDVRSYSVIYEALEEVRGAMAGLLPPKMTEEERGEAEVRATFSVPKLGMIAGCYVSAGKAMRGGMGRVYRGKEEIAAGEIVSLKRFKDDAKEVAAGLECGVAIRGFKGFQENDRIKFFELIAVPQELGTPISEMEPKKGGDASDAKS